MSDEETQEFTPVPGDDGDDGDEQEVPPPATYAGRRRAEESAGEGPAADQPDQPAAEQPEAEQPEGEQPGAEQPADVDADAVEQAEAEEEAEELTTEPAEEPAPEAEVEEPEVAEPEEPEAEAAEEVEEEGAEPPQSEQPDRAEAEEAALAGLRARTAEHKPKQPVTVAASPPPAASADEEDEGPPPRAKPIWARFLAASLMIVMSMAAATSISLLVFLNGIAEGLRDNGVFAKISDQLPAVEGGAPQTILILGSDKRPTDITGRSDTTILLRVDPDRDVVSLLSIPRDLKVNIPGVGVDKLNAAYSYGGPKLTYKVVQNLIGKEAPIHHLVNINFTGFANAVNAIGCVYIDVDRRYFIPPNSGVAEINIEAGYQRLCGLKALQYVRFRHEDTDLVRSARQQDFLREARQKLEPEQIIRDTSYRNKLVDIFTEYTTSDIDSATTLLELIKTFLGASDATVNEVHFPAQLGGPDALYVTANDEDIKHAVQQFLGTEGTPAPPPEGTNNEEEKPDNGAGGKPHHGGDDKPEKPPEDTGPAMEDVAATGEAVAKQLEAVKRKDGDPMLDFPVMYPTRMLPGSTLQTVDQASRAFVIDGPSDDVFHGYKIVLDFFGNGFSEYYGVSGTDWVDAPILQNPSETREIDGRNYLLFYDGDRLRLVGWKTGKAAYWVNNTLTQSLDEDVMLSIATSMRELGH